MKEIFDPNLQILHSLIFRRALPVRGELAGGLTPAFFLQTKKGHGFSRFSGRRNAVCYACRSCGPTSAPQVCPFFLPLIYPHTRSTLRDNRVQRERWGSYTIFTLRTANLGLSVRVSDHRSLHVPCHSYYCKGKRRIYNYQVIYNLSLCYYNIYYLVYLIYKPMTS